MRPIEYRTAHGGELITEGPSYTPYSGPTDRTDSQMSILNQRVTRRDGVETTVGDLLTLTEALQSGLVEQSKKIAELEAKLRMMHAADNASDALGVLDSRHASRADTDDTDPFLAQQTRIAAGRQTASRAAPQGRADAGDGEDFDPAERMQQRLSQGRAR